MSSVTFSIALKPLELEPPPTPPSQGGESMRSLQSDLKPPPTPPFARRGANAFPTVS